MCSQRKCKVVAEGKRAKGVTYLLAAWPNAILHIHDDYCLSEVLVSHFEMFALGVGLEKFPSIREANSYSEEGMTLTFGGKSRLTPNSATGYHQFLCILLSQVIFQP